MRHAAELAVREINARGGIRGRQLALRIMDDSGSPEVAMRIAQQLVEDPSVVAVVGAVLVHVYFAGRSAGLTSAAAVDVERSLLVPWLEARLS